jgi:putative methyltransferase (TIGR04325 family)
MVIAGRRLSHDYDLPIQFLDAEKDSLQCVDVLILSGVLQYLPDPWGALADLLKRCAPRLVIVDRTAVRLGSSRWSVQTNPGYYTRSVTYPIQVLDRRRLMNSFPGYRLEREWHNSFDAQRPEHIGLLFVRNGDSA